MAKEKKKGFVLRALDTVEHVGNALPNPATIFLILTGVVIVLSAICAACGSWTAQREKSPRKPLLQSAFWHLTASVTW